MKNKHNLRVEDRTVFLRDRRVGLLPAGWSEEKFFLVAEKFGLALVERDSHTLDFSIDQKSGHILMLCPASLKPPLLTWQEFIERLRAWALQDFSSKTS